uniref:Thioredoxin domain containing 11 n=1 Tax=Neogobius melanostomus TaxID=47308 RepID=A0A8C6SY13_9GOBI
MARRPEFLCGAILLGVLLVLAIKFTCSRAKNVVAPAQPPVRFFSSEAPVVDLYLGQIDQVERLRSVAEVSLIFLYAPWCAHSMAARQEVQLVAKKLAKQVQFVAVNCWWNQGRCRKQNRLYQYPIIHLFYRRYGPIEYKGPFVAPYVESFILKVITPLTYLSSQAKLQDFLSYHEPRVVGFFQFNSSPQPPGYLTYVSSALQALRRDFRGAVRFGVVTNRQVAQSIPVQEEGSIYLHRSFNSSLIFPRAQLNFTSEAICRWVFEHYQSVIQWLQPPGTKSRLLEEELSKGPALLLFLPHDPLGSQPSALLQQVSASLATQLESFTPTGAACCHSVPVPQSAAVCELCLEHSGPWTSLGCAIPPVAPSRLSPVSCSSYLIYSAFRQYSACCATNLTKETPPTPGPRARGVTGLHCHTNKTLRFYLLDAELNWPLAVRLGAPHKNRKGHSTIVDVKEEVHYVLQPKLHRELQRPYSVLRRHLVGQEQVQSDAPPLIAEVTSSSFTHTVLDPQQDVLLIYYTQWCSFCSMLNHVLIQLARLLQGNGALTVARVNVALNDLPWEFMVDQVPTVLLFPRYRKHQSVKFPEDQPITLPNLLRFVLQHSDSVRSPHTAAGEGGPGLLRAQVKALQAEVGQLHRACERLSQQLAQLWRDQRRLSMDTRALETHNQELQHELRSLEEQHRHKSQQLDEAVRRLHELAHTSESLLRENTLLRVLLRALRDRAEAGDEEDRDSKESRDSEQQRALRTS